MRLVIEQVKIISLPYFQLWELASGRLKLTLTGHISSIRGLAVSPRQPYLFSCGEDKQVKCWDLEQNKVYTDIIVNYIYGFTERKGTGRGRGGLCGEKTEIPPPKRSISILQIRLLTVIINILIIIFNVYKCHWFIYTIKKGLFQIRQGHLTVDKVFFF